MRLNASQSQDKATVRWPLPTPCMNSHPRVFCLSSLILLFYYPFRCSIHMRVIHDYDSQVARALVPASGIIALGVAIGTRGLTNKQQSTVISWLIFNSGSFFVQMPRIDKRCTVAKFAPRIVYVPRALLPQTRWVPKYIPLTRRGGTAYCPSSGLRCDLKT
jgi:hypothetical protein